MSLFHIEQSKWFVDNAQTLVKLRNGNFIWSYHPFLQYVLLFITDYWPLHLLSWELVQPFFNWWHQSWNNIPTYNVLAASSNHDESILINWFTCKNHITTYTLNLANVCIAAYILNTCSEKDHIQSLTDCSILIHTTKAK